MTDTYRVIQSDGCQADYLLHKYFVNDFRTGYVEVGRNKTCLPIKYLKFKDQIRDFAIRNEDVWVISHPETGTVWLQEMVWCILHNLDFQKAKAPLQERVPFLEHSILYDFDNINLKGNVEIPASALRSINYVSKKRGSRCIKTHLPWELLPLAIQTRKSKSKILYICRNPKDTCVSYYHHCRVAEGFAGTFEDFCELFMAGRVSFSPYLKHVKEFWERRNEPNILFLKYEDLKANLRGEIKKVSQFLEKDLSPEQVEILARHLSCENMRSNPSINYEDILNMNEKGGSAGDAAADYEFAVGSYKSQMNPELIMKFDNWINQTMEHIPLHF